MYRSVATVVAFLSLAVIPASADALELLSSEELAIHCAAFPDDSDSVDGQYCIRYIQGFIDGAAATDVRVMLNIEAEKETFSERAIRIRMVDRSSQHRAETYAEYCLGDPVPLAEVVTKVVGDLNERIKAIDSTGTARDAVYESLRRHFPCEKS